MEQVACVCAVCGSQFTRPKSHIRSKNVFCSRKHKEKGMILGLVAPMRLGTGYGIKDILTRRKFYKYIQFDRKHGYPTVTMGVRAFVKLINESVCVYCNSKNDLGFDRLNNKDGHHERNVVIACNRCNMTRGDRFTHEQMKQIGATIRGLAI